MSGDEVANELYISGCDRTATVGQHSFHDHFLPEMAMERKSENEELSHF